LRKNSDKIIEVAKAGVAKSEGILSNFDHTTFDLFEELIKKGYGIEEAIEAGKIRSGGVSNYGVHHLQELLNSKPKVLPSINQVELHPFLQRKDIDDFCKEHGIYLEGMNMKCVVLMR